MSYQGNPVRLLIVPGLHGSGEAHWQTWLEAHFRSAVRVQQDDWARADLDRWAARVGDTLARHPGTRWVAVGHSFGCLAIARHLALREQRRVPGAAGIQAALLVAPADPEKFAVESLLPKARLPVPSVLVGSETDSWMSAASARQWARRWGSQFINLGDVGHINVDAGFGPLPPAKTLSELLIQRVERARRIERAHPLELSFAI